MVPVYLQTGTTVGSRKGGKLPADTCRGCSGHTGVFLTAGTHLKKGFFKSRRLLDFDPVWSTWATILIS